MHVDMSRVYLQPRVMILGIYELSLVLIGAYIYAVLSLECSLAAIRLVWSSVHHSYDVYDDRIYNMLWSKLSNTFR